MKGCIAPSEVRGISEKEASLFGQLAEDLIGAEFRSKRIFAAYEIFIDNNNPAPYLFFLARHNPQFTEAIQKDYYRQVYTDREYRRPDILVHTFAEMVFYEIKPDSTSGRSAGKSKVNILADTYNRYKLPYKPGINYSKVSIPVASFTNQLKASLTAELLSPGLIVYKLCLESGITIDSAIQAALLRYIIQKLLEQRNSTTFRPVDLQPAFSREGQLSALAGALGLIMASPAGKTGWNFFWRAVVKRFAAREALAATLAAADGPLPVGDLIAIGISIWTIMDIIRYSDALWMDADKLSRQSV